MNFKEELELKREEVDKFIMNLLPDSNGFESTLIAPMNYNMLVGGKRIRPILMKETYHLFQQTGEDILYFAAAMELIHTSSLVHDDLPAIDNDEYRRGQKTCHAKFGEDMAVLAGDGLLNYAYEILAMGMQKAKDIHLYAKAFQVLSHKAGVFGMLGGQTKDVAMTGKKIDRDTLMFIHERKTGALIEASMMCGAILAGASEEHIKKIEKIASNIGLAFQIRDDILDLISTSEELGKPVKSDVKNHKTTYVTEFGMEKACQDVDELSRSAIELLHTIPYENKFLEELILFLVLRKK